MDLTAKEIVLAILGSGGVIGGLVTAFSFISGRIDVYRARKKERSSESAGERSRLVDDLWRMIDAERKESELLRGEIAELEDSDKFSRPKISQLYRLIRNMRHELDQVNIMVLDQESTNIFIKRWEAVKKGCDDLEDLLSSAGTGHTTDPPHMP